MKASATEKAIIEARQITKQFPGVLALNKVDLKVYAGKVIAVVGENGAGKSTLMNILSGVYTEFDGELLLDGQKAAFNNTTDARNVGISIIHQELQLVPHMSISENIFLGRDIIPPKVIALLYVEPKLLYFYLCYAYCIFLPQRQPWK